jgi:sugar transferase (PEP-CTERM/EpsH1 system associated)
VGGLEQIIKNTIQTMPEEISHAIVCLTTADPSFAKSLPDRVEIVQLEKNDGERLLTYRKMFTALKKLKPDVLHTYNLATIEFQAIGMLLGVPCRLHAEHGRDLSDPDGTNKKYIAWRKIFSRFTHYHVGVSNDLHQWLIHRVNIPKHKAKLIYNGVDTKKFSPELSDEQSDKPILTFGHVARLDGIKNQANLINAFISACESSSEFAQGCRLAIIGDGPEKQQLKTRINDSAFADNIQMWGARSDMPFVYNQFDVFVLSSDAEGTPMSILEAMATGLPILSTKVGGIPEIVNDACAKLVPSKNVEALSDGFIHLFNNISGLAKMSEFAREHVVKHFSQAKMNNEYLSIYKSRL